MVFAASRSTNVYDPALSRRRKAIGLLKYELRRLAKVRGISGVRTVAVSPDGNIRIYGRINAQDGVRLTGQNVFVGGATQRDIANLDHAAKFAASVNSKGLRSASAIIH